MSNKDIAKLETRIYSNSNKYSIRQLLRDSLKGYKSSFYLAKQLAKRDITSQHRQSIFGIFWVILPVLMNALVWIFLQSSGTINLTATAIPYPLFVLIGTTVWSIFGECLNMPIGTINGNRGIITKINFEKEALITLGFIKIGFNLLIKLGMILFFILYFQVVPTVSIVLFFPFLLLMMLFFISVGIIISPIGILYNDISRFIPIALQLLMYITPVLYVVPKSGLMQKIMSLNPLSYIITDIRNTLTAMPIENGIFWLFFLLVTLFLSLIAMVVYRVSMPIITERMSA
ncbi:ABC transporter permease [Flavobacterium degerlachei]|jgi:lipopolysaccharide transport system permease protein|uniref:Lipopolysaccharide transport system permease protein n=1 Tax=Flavobacterium degerlachei TaxID=229203 RepID=A0A1H2VTK6_9FLAO|nr:ABC transporter permease [Flavobacterium degerlachei]SDW71557.1 lipopolysaccharide transport system permease protein [Flavobacterium degerlachei]